MGRNVYIKHVSNEGEDYGYDPGCMWGFVHALDYHHWHSNVRKKLQNKKYEGGRHANGIANSETSLFLHDSDELQLLEDIDNHLQVNQKTKYTHMAKKRSLKARIKGLIGKEAKQENGEKQKSGSSPRLLLRTHSIHHREPSDRGLSEICKDQKPAIIFLPYSLDNGNTSLKVPNNPVQSNMYDMNNASEHQVNEDRDILEIFKVDRDLFLKVVENTDNSTGKSFRKGAYFSTKEILTRSGSFPTADLSRRRNFKPSKLEHKKNEIWFSPGEERFSDYTQVPELAVLKYKNHSRAKSWSLAYDNDYSTIDQKSSSVSQVSKRELKKEGQNEIVIPPKVRKLTVEPAGKEDKSKDCISASSLYEFSSRQVPSGSEKDTSGTSGQCAIDRDSETDPSKCNELDGYLLSKVVLRHRRSSSLSESLDRYTRLYEHSSRPEVKLHPSKSLKLRNEYDLLSGGNVSFRRMRSLSHLDFYYPIQNEGPHDAQYEDWPLETVPENSSAVGVAQTEDIRADIPLIADDKATLDASKETVDEIIERTETIQTLGNVASLGTYAGSGEMDELIEKVDDSTVDKSTTDREESINFSEIGAERLSQSFLASTSGASFLEEASPAYLSEDPENICNHVDENDSSINSEQRVNVDSLSRYTPALENVEHTNKDSRKFGYSEILKGDDAADLEYVMGILELSDICRDDFSTAPWHSLDQPVNPSVFEEMEGYWHNELEFSEEDVYSCSHHQLLFDLINEEMVQMYNTSLTYYPKALSTTCRVRSLPAGNRILDEVSASITKLLNRKPDRYQTVDNIVSQDLSKDDGWMNLQLETECVALELEELIFDELLEEILCS